MHLFTKSIDSRDIQTIIQHQLKVEIALIKLITFSETPSMQWVEFPYKGQTVRVIHHMLSRRYSFEGSLIKFDIKSPMNDEDIDFLGQVFMDTLGGIFDAFGDGEALQGAEAPGADDSEFLLSQLHLKGFTEAEITEALEELEQRIDLIKKSNA